MKLDEAEALIALRLSPLEAAGFVALFVFAIAMLFAFGS